MTIYLSEDDVESEQDVCRCGHRRCDHWGSIDNSGVIEGCYGDGYSDEGDGRCWCPGFEEADQ